MMIQDLITMLDNVLEFFIENAPDSLSRARYSAEMERSIGLGAMGFHNLLQRNQIPFESDQASTLNEQVFSRIKSEAKAASISLGKSRGGAPDMLNSFCIRFGYFGIL